jgi:anti-sigma-K factor RskA
MADEDFDVLAAEYVLGTLTAEERASVERLAAKDSGFAGRIAHWERRLGTLEAMVDPVEPPAEVWNRIRAKLAETVPDAALRLPEVATAAAPGATNVVVLRTRVRRWRGVAALTGAIAATLLIFAGVGRYRPELLPPELKPPVETKVVEKVVERVVERVVQAPAPPPPAPARFVAVLQRDPGAPAFLLTVDVANRSLTVRRVAPPEAGRSHELWLVSDRFPAPRSLGLIGGGEFTQRAALAAYEPEVINSATYAVSLEPEGGSPTGTPTGPVLFTGRLVEAVPPTPAAPRP